MPYRPRMLVRLNVPLLGTTADRQVQETETNVFSYDARVTRATVVQNDHNMADELEVTVDASEAGTDPRLFTNAEVYFYLANADERGNWTAGPDTLRFVGIVVDVERAMGESARAVTFRAHDYTTLFLKSKPLPESGVPELSETLRQAWQRICDNTGAWDFTTNKIVSSVQALRDRIDFVGVSGDLVLSSAVSKRFRDIGGKVQTHGDEDAWAVWQRCVGMLGLISFIRKDRCVVTTATDYYTASAPPRFIWGRNVFELTERRDVATLCGKGVALTSFDASTGTSVDAFWPPRADPEAEAKKAAASGKTAPKTVVVKDYEFFDYPDVSDEKVLTAIAQRVWEERSRQELTGQLKTGEMTVETLTSGGSSLASLSLPFDVLSLQSGDRIRVELEEDALNAIMRIPTEAGRVDYLTARGYAQGLATLMAKNVSGLARFAPEFQVRTARTTHEINDDSGTYETEITFINRIDVSGDARASSAQPGLRIQ